MLKKKIEELSNEEIVFLIQQTNEERYWKEIENRTKKTYSYVLREYVHSFYKETMLEDILTILKIGWVKAINTYNEKKATSDFIPYCIYLMYQSYVMFARRIDENKVGTSVRDSVLSSIVIDGHENTDQLIAGCLENIMGYETDSYDDIESNDFTRDMLNRLKEYDYIQYKVVSEHCIKGVTQKELGNKLGMSQSAISRCIKRGLSFLKKEILNEKEMLENLNTY